MEKRGKCQKIERILLIDRPGYLRSMASGVAKGSEHADDKVHQPCLLILLGFALKSVESEVRHPDFAKAKRFLCKLASISLNP